MARVLMAVCPEKVETIWQNTDDERPVSTIARREFGLDPDVVRPPFHYELGIQIIEDGEKPLHLEMRDRDYETGEALE